MELLMKTYKEFNLELQERVQMVKGGVVGAKLSYSKLMKAYKHLNKVGADFRFKPFYIFFNSICFKFII